MNWYIFLKTTLKDVRGEKNNQAAALFSAEAPADQNWAKYLYEPLPDALTVPYFKLERGAKKTDLISSVKTSYGRLLVSDELYNCLSKFRISTFKAYSTKLIDTRKNEYDYKIFMQNLQTDVIDYTKSTFCKYVKNETTDKYEYVEVKGIKNYQDSETKQATFVRSLILKEQTLFDCLLIKASSTIFLVTEKVKNALLEKNMTGFCLVPFNQGENFIDEMLIDKALKYEKKYSDIRGYAS